MRAIIVRPAMTAAYLLKETVFRLTGRRPFGVHGLVITISGAIVLVRLTYAPGRQLPGGGLKRDESPRDGLLREMREEIGLRPWDTVEELDKRLPLRSPDDRGALFVVRGAVFHPRRSLEIAEARAFMPTALPQELAPWTRTALARYGWR